MFLVISRAQTSYSKWAESRNHWGDTHVVCRNLSLQAMCYVKDFHLATRICRYLIVYAISVRCWLRSEPVAEDLLANMLTPSGLRRLLRVYEQREEAAPQAAGGRRSSLMDGLSWQFRHECMPLVCLEVIRECLDEAAERKIVG